MHMHLLTVVPVHAPREGVEVRRGGRREVDGNGDVVESLLADDAGLVREGIFRVVGQQVDDRVVALTAQAGELLRR